MNTKKLTAAAVSVLLTIGAGAANPFVTQDTRKVAVPCGTTIAAVSDGVVTLKNKDNKYAFYSLVERKFITDFDWLSNQGVYGPAPRFNGACSVSKAEGEKSWDMVNTYYILHKDGTAIQLFKEVKELSPFVDGMCCIKYEAPDRQSKTTKAIYIDANGKDVFEEFTEVVKPGYLSDPRMGPECDGMRAVLKVEGKLWGYADKDGKTVIAPRFAGAGNFSEGLAFATTSSNYDRKYGIINKKGEFVAAEKLDLGSAQELPVFHAGLALLPSRKAYADAKGNLLQLPVTLREATPFGDDGLAFVHLDGDYNKTYIMDKTGAVTEAATNFELNPGSGKTCAWTGGVIWLKANSEYVLVDSKGDMVLAGCKFPNSYQRQSEIKDYNGDSSATITYRETPDGAELPGVCDLKGAIICLFVPGKEEDDANGGRLRKGGPDGPDKDITIINVPPRTEYADIRVVASPAEAAKCHGSGRFPKGMQRHLAAIPVSDEWSFVGWQCEDEQMKKSLNKDDSFYVGPDQTVTALFTRRPDTIPQELKGAYAAEGMIDNIWISPEFPKERFKVDVYLQLDPQGQMKSSYPGTQYGVLAVGMKPGSRFNSSMVIGKKHYYIPSIGELFFAPYKITGTMVEDGRTYFTMVGGHRMVGVIKDGDKTPDENAAIVAFLSMFGRGTKKNSALFINRVWDFRIEYTMRDDGTIALGKMERYNAEYGWCDPDDERLKKYRGYNALVMRWTVKAECDVNGAMLDGTVLKPAAVKNVDYMPPAYWFEHSKDPEGEKKQIFTTAYEKGVTELSASWMDRESAIKRMNSYSLQDIYDDWEKK